MSVGAAIRITSPDAWRVIERAAAFARQNSLPCYVISVVPSLPYGTTGEDDAAVVRHNLGLIASQQASPVMQEGDDVPGAILEVARGFGIATLFVKSASAQGTRRSIAEQILQLDPPFDVVVVGSE